MGQAIWLQEILPEVIKIVDPFISRFPVIGSDGHSWFVLNERLKKFVTFHNTV